MKKLFGMVFAVLIVLGLIACSSSDNDGESAVLNNDNNSNNNTNEDENNDEDDENAGNTNALTFVSIQSVTSSGIAAHSNEVQVPANTSTQLAIGWEQPTRTISGDCLVDTISAYKVNIGAESGKYTAVQDIAIADVSCEDTEKADALCDSNIKTCSANIDLSGF